MSKRKKKIVIQLNVRPIWMLGTGHHEHRSGGGQHNNKPKRLRTRSASRKQAIVDGW